jgi:hypothetical protein
MRENSLETWKGKNIQRKEGLPFKWKDFRAQKARKTFFVQKSFFLDSKSFCDKALIYLTIDFSLHSFQFEKGFKFSEKMCYFCF